MSHQRLLEARENWCDQITNSFSLHPIGWESDLSFLDQSQQTESFSVVCHNTKTKLITTANQKKGKHFKSQWELKVKTIKLAKARENAGEQAAIVFNFASDWLRGWREFSGPITKRSKAEPKHSRVTFEN